jgi:hypothetical protein
MSRFLNFFTPQASPRTRAASPPGSLTDVITQMGEQQNEIYRNRCEEYQVINVMIEKIYQFSGIDININIDESDQHVRFIIKKIILVHGLTDAAIEKIKRCRPLLSAISNAIAHGTQGLQARATTWLQGAPGRLQQALVFTARQTASLTGQCLVRGAQFISGRVSNVTDRMFQGRHPPPQGRGSHSPERGARDRSRTPPRKAAVQIAPLDFVTSALSELYGVLSRVLTSVSHGIIQLYQAITTAAPAAPAAVPECAICMATESDIPERLGYIVGHGHPDRGHPDRGHPDRFHQSCLQGCREICPMCRAPNPLWSLEPPALAQGGGGGGAGLKKYRSRSRSKSKSKSRRYISKPRKSRKAGKRIRHYSSRRK